MNTTFAFAVAMVSTTLFFATCFTLFLTIKHSTKGFIIFGIVAFSVSLSIYIAMLKHLINNLT